PTRVYENAPDLVEWLSSEMMTYDVKPEVEAFDLSMIFQAAKMAKAGKIQAPLHTQFVMGVKNAMPVDRDVFEFYIRTLKRLASDATWTGVGIGRDQITLNRWSLELGGHCRTGLEDNVRLDRETLAPSNAALVRRVVDLCRSMDVTRRQSPRRAACWVCRLAGSSDAGGLDAWRRIAISRVPTLEELQPRLPSGLKTAFEPSTELVRWARQSPDSPSAAQRFRRKTGRRTFACKAGRIPLRLPGHRECCEPLGNRYRPPRDRTWPQGRHSSFPG